MELKSNFENNNTKEINNFLVLQAARNSFPPERSPAPQLRFFDDALIDAGYYDFRIGDLIFTDCWIEPFSKTSDGPYEYHSGSYYVHSIN